jgi:zinc transport system ATP-binding protein
MPESILEVKNLNIELDSQKIIENLSFEVKEGETLVILGPNGAGKTVLFRTLLGLLPYRGEINWKENLKVSYIPTSLPLVKEFPLTIKEFFSLKEITPKEILEMLDTVGMLGVDILEKKIAHLSTGQFQRVLVAWGLCKDPQVLLFDEPTAGIDVKGQESIYAFLNRLRKEKNLTILLITHDLSVVYELADRIICLNKKVICRGTPKEVLTPQHLAQLYGGEIKFYQHTKIHD